MTHNRESTQEIYQILVKEFLEKEDYLFDHVVNNKAFLGRLVYVYVSLFGEDAVGENHMAVFMQVIEEVFCSLVVEKEEVYKLVVQLQGDMEHAEGSIMPPGVGNGRAGYIYVVINPSMPNQVKIGHTTRDPKIRVSELSKHPGIAMPFILVYKKYFEDCIREEERIHTILDRQGYRVAENREFFSMPVDEVIRLVGGTGSSSRDDEPVPMIF